MKKRIWKVLAVLAVLMIVGGSFSLVGAWHDSGGPNGTGVASLGTAPFSLPLTSLLRDAGYRTCVIGNFRGTDYSTVEPIEQGHAQEHHWQYLSRTGGNVTLVITKEEGFGSLTLTANHDPTFISSTSSVTVTGTDHTVAMTVPVTAGVAYDLTVEFPVFLGPPPVPAHYTIGVIGPGAANVELGYGDPVLEYLESLGQTKQRWAFNTADGESVSLEISVDDTVPSTLFLPGVPPQANSVTYAVVDPSDNSFAISQTTSAVGLGSPLTIGFTNTSGSAKTYVFEVRANGHFKLQKTSGTDQGLYAQNCPSPFIVKELLAPSPLQVPISQPTPTQFVFRIRYEGAPALVLDTVPAEFEVLSLVASNGTATSFQVSQGQGFSATRIEWQVTGPGPGSTLDVTIRTVQSPGKHHGQIVYKPTSCGPLTLNDGATAYETVPVLDVATQVTVPTLVSVAGPSNALVVQAVAGAQPCEGG